jgi:RNA polymerase subunit RPABC4/transcription elongation factor Spt4
MANDWKCKKCGGTNPGKRETCLGCNTSRNTVETSEQLNSTPLVIQAEKKCNACGKQTVHWEEAIVITANSEDYRDGSTKIHKNTDFHRIRICICADCLKDRASGKKAVINKDTEFGRVGSFNYWAESEAMEVFKNIWATSNINNQGFDYFKNIMKDELDDNSQDKSSTLLFHAKNHFLVEQYPGRLYVDGILLAFNSYGRGFDMPVKVGKGKHTINIVVGLFRLNLAKGFTFNAEEGKTYEFDCNIDRMMGGVKLIPRFSVN